MIAVRGFCRSPVSSSPSCVGAPRHIVEVALAASIVAAAVPAFLSATGEPSDGVGVLRHEATGVAVRLALEARDSVLLSQKARCAQGVQSITCSVPAGNVKPDGIKVQLYEKRTWAADRLPSEKVLEDCAWEEAREKHVAEVFDRCLAGHAVGDTVTLYPVVTAWYCSVGHSFACWAPSGTPRSPAAN